MQNDWDWTKKYYSREARERLEERLKTARTRRRFRRSKKNGAVDRD
jgi:hypothetical protein